ncbi:MAG: helix-turn-helix domain-containing protein [Acidimicrobiales bacterium]
MEPRTVKHALQPLWDSKTTAEYLRIPAGTLDQWAHRGGGPPFSKIGKHRRYDPRKVQAFVEANERGASA